jgi:hypothetical protein
MLRVEVEWVDSGAMLGDDMWTSTEKIKAKAKIGSVTTTGLLIDLNDDHALVGLSYDMDFDNWFGVQVIQRAAIKKIIVLRQRKEYTPEMFDALPKGVL